MQIKSGKDKIRKQEYFEKYIIYNHFYFKSPFKIFKIRNRFVIKKYLINSNIFLNALYRSIRKFVNLKYKKKFDSYFN